MSLQRIPARVLLPIAAFAPVALAACGSSARGVSRSTTTSVAPGSSGTTLTATETEYRIALSSPTASAGQVTISVKNAGQVTHNLVVNGPGVQDQKTVLLSPGQTAQLVVTLKAGTYDVYCGIPGHKQAGMDAKLSVS